MKLPRTFESACKVLKRNPKKLPGVKDLEPEMACYILAQFKLATIAEAINLLRKWKIDWTNSDQYKYFPVFYQTVKNGKPSRFAFTVSDYGWTGTHSHGGSRLCLSTREDSDYFGTQFIELWNDLLMM